MDLLINYYIVCTHIYLKFYLLACWRTASPLFALTIRYNFRPLFKHCKFGVFTLELVNFFAWAVRDLKQILCILLPLLIIKLIFRIIATLCTFLIPVQTLSTPYLQTVISHEQEQVNQFWVCTTVQKERLQAQ